MSEKTQMASCGCDSNNRILDVIQTSRNAPLRSSWAIEAPDPYSEIEFGYYAHLSLAKNLPEFEYKIEQSIKELGFQQFSYFRSDGGAGASEKLVTVSQELIADYFSECFFEHDLILPYVDHNVSPIYQSTLHDYAKNAPFNIGMTEMMKVNCENPVSFIGSGELIISESEEDNALAVLISQIDYIRNLSSVDTVVEFRAEVMEIVEGLGFTDYALIFKTDLGTIDAAHSSLSEKLFMSYENEGYCRFDMVLDYINSGIGKPILLSMIRDAVENSPVKTYTLQKNSEILSLYQDFGISNAYVIPVKGASKDSHDRGVLTVMAIGMDDGEFRVKCERYGPLLKVLADAVSYIHEQRFNHTRPDGEIKPKALRLLSTMAKCDLSLAEAADQLCISLDTANKHMALAKQALGTGSQAHAVYLAIRKGLIQL